MLVLGEHFSVLSRHDLLQYLTPSLDLVLLPQLDVTIPCSGCLSPWPFLLFAFLLMF